MKREDGQAVRKMTARSRRSLIGLPPSVLSPARPAGFHESSLTRSWTHERTSWHLFHEDLDVSILRNRAQILNNVPVLQVLVEGDFFMEGLRVPKNKRQTGLFTIPASSIKRRVLLDLPAVPLRDLLDGDPDLVAEVSPCIHHSISAPP